MTGSTITLLIKSAIASGMPRVKITRVRKIAFFSMTLTGNMKIPYAHT